jgi:hypothetical protein
VEAVSGGDSSFWAGSKLVQEAVALLLDLRFSDG